MNTTPECTKALRELEEYLDGELCAEDATDIRKHLETCDSCRDERTVRMTLSNALRGSCKEAAPEELRARVMAGLREAQASH